MNKRKNYIDNLRCGVVLIVILYHIIYNFNSVGVIRNVNIQGVPQMDIFLYIVYPWFMACLFVLAGMSARFALAVRSDRQFLKERVHKLLIPSIAGIFLIGWFSGFVTNQYSDMFMGAGEQIPVIAKYLIYCMTGIGPLWFAQQLFVASLVLLLIRKVDKQDKIWNFCGKTNLPVLVLLFFAVWGSSNLLNLPVIEVFRNGIYIFCFLLGYYVFSHAQVEMLVEKYRYCFLGASLLFGVCYTVSFWGENYALTKNLAGPLCNAYVWTTILALLGCTKRWFDSETVFTRYMRPRSFGFYVLHYPLLMVFTYILDQNFKIKPMMFYLLLFVLELLFLPFVYEVIKRIPVVNRLLLGE